MINQTKSLKINRMNLKMSTKVMKIAIYSNNHNNNSKANKISMIPSNSSKFRLNLNNKSKMTINNSI